MAKDKKHTSDQDIPDQRPEDQWFEDQEPVIPEAELPAAAGDLELPDEPSLFTTEGLLGYITKLRAISVTEGLKGAARKKAEDFIDKLCTSGKEKIGHSKTVQKYKPEILRIIKKLLKSYVEENHSYSIKKLSNKLDEGDFPEAKKLIKDSIVELLNDTLEKILGPVVKPVMEKVTDPAKKKLDDQAIVKWIQAKEKLRELKATLSLPFLDEVFGQFNQQLDRQMSRFGSVKKMAGLDDEALAIIAKLSPKRRDQLSKHLNNYYFSEHFSAGVPLLKSAWPQIIKEPFFPAFLDVLEQGVRETLVPEKEYFPTIKKIFTEFTVEEINRIMHKSESIKDFQQFGSDLNYHKNWEHWYYYLKMIRDNPELLEKWQELSKDHLLHLAQLGDFYGVEVFERIRNDQEIAEKKDRYRSYELEMPSLSVTQKKACLDYIHANVPSDEFSKLTTGQLERMMKNLGHLALSLSDDILHDIKLTAAIFDFIWYVTRPGSKNAVQYSDSSEFIKNSKPGFLKQNRERIVSISTMAKHCGGMVLWHALQNSTEKEAAKLAQGCEVLGKLEGVELDPSYQHFGREDQREQWLKLLMEAGDEKLNKGLVHFIKLVIEHTQEGRLVYEKGYQSKEYALVRTTYKNISIDSLTKILSLSPWLNNLPDQDYEQGLTFMGMERDTARLFTRLKDTNAEYSGIETQIICAKLEKFWTEFQLEWPKEKMKEKTEALPAFLELSTEQKKLYLLIEQRKKDRRPVYGNRDTADIVRDPDCFATLKIWIDEPSTQTWPLDLLEKVKQKPQLKGLLYYINDFSDFDKDIYETLEELHDKGLPDVYYLSAPRIKPDAEDDVDDVRPHLRGLDVDAFLRVEKCIAEFIDHPNFAKLVRNFQRGSIERDLRDFSILAESNGALKSRFGGPLKEGQELEQAIVQSTDSKLIRRVLHMKTLLQTDSLEAITKLESIGDELWEKIENWPYLGKWYTSLYQAKDITWLFSADERLLRHPKFWQYLIHKSRILQYPDICLEILDSPLLPTNIPPGIVPGGRIIPNYLTPIIDLRLKEPQFFQEPYLSCVTDFNELMELSREAKDLDMEQITRGRKAYKIAIGSMKHYLAAHAAGELIAPPRELHEELQKRCQGQYDWHIAHLIYGYQQEGIPVDQWRQTFWERYNQENSYERICLPTFLQVAIHATAKANVDASPEDYGLGKEEEDYLLRHGLQERFLRLLRLCDSKDKKWFLTRLLNTQTAEKSRNGPHGYAPKADYRPDHSKWDIAERVITHPNFDLLTSLGSTYEVFSVPREFLPEFLDSLSPALVEFQKRIPSGVVYKTWQLPAIYSHPNIESIFRLVRELRSLRPKNWYSDSTIPISHLFFVDSEKALQQLGVIKRVMEMGVGFQELGPVCRQMSANKDDIQDICNILGTFIKEVPVKNDSDEVLKKLKSMPPSIVRELFRNDAKGLMGWGVFKHEDELQEMHINKEDLTELTLLYWKNNIEIKDHVLDRDQVVAISKILTNAEEFTRLWDGSDRREETFKLIIDTAKAAGKLGDLFKSSYHIGYHSELKPKFTPALKNEIAKDIIENTGGNLDVLRESFFEETLPSINQYCTDALDNPAMEMSRKQKMLTFVLAAISQLGQQFDEEAQQKIIEKSAEVPREQRYQFLTDFVGLLDLTSKSASAEVQKIKFELLSTLLDMPGSNIDEQKAVLGQLIAFFEKNNIPLCGKVAEVFRKIYNKSRFVEAYERHSSNRHTATLQTLRPTQNPNNYAKLIVLFRNDLLHTALRSNDANLRAYFEKLSRYRPIVDQFQEIMEQNDDQALQKYIDTTPELAAALNVYTVVAHTVAGTVMEQSPETPEEYRTLFNQIYESFTAKKKHERLTSHFIRVFFGGFGIKTPEEALQYMDRVSEQATERNQKYVENGLITLTPGDYVKGMGIESIKYCFFEGNKGREFLGSDTHESDSTPFDVDWTRIDDNLPEGTDFTSIIRGTSYPGYSNGESGIGLIIKNRGQFYESGDYGTARAALKNPEGQYETVFSGVINCPFAQHYGIRTAIPSSEFSAVIVNPEKIQNYDEKLRIIKENIARCGTYIPICDLTGQVIYSFEEWQKLTTVFREMERAMDDESGDAKFNEPVMEAVSGPGGSTPYQWFRDSMGKKYLYKFYGDLLKSVNEGFYCRLYQHLGFNAPKANLGRYNGKAAFVSQEIVGALSANNGDQAAVEQEKIRGFVADCLFANWDAPQNDNILYTEGEHGEMNIWRVDNGGAGIYRAADHGGTSHKKNAEDFGAEIREFESFFDPAMNSGYAKFKDTITADMIIEQGEHILAILSPEVLDQLYEKSGMLAAEMGEARKSNEILKKRLEFLREKINKLKIQKRQEAREILKGRTFTDILATYNAGLDETLCKLIPLWVELNGENGYQHNMDHVGRHTVRVMEALKASAEYSALGEKEQEIALLAAFFHDFGKAHGKQGGAIARDYEHDQKSARLAQTYLSILGYDPATIHTITLVILNDGQVSDWARGKNPELTVEDLRERLENDSQAIRVLRAMNAADVRGLQDGDRKFEKISPKYHQFFDKL